MNKWDIIIRILKEMQLNYKNQHPKKIPDIKLITNISSVEIKKLK